MSDDSHMQLRVAHWLRPHKSKSLPTPPKTAQQKERNPWRVKTYYGGAGVEVYPVRRGNHPMKAWPKDLGKGSVFGWRYVGSKAELERAVPACQQWCDKENQNLEWWDEVQRYG